MIQGILKKLFGDKSLNDRKKYQTSINQMNFTDHSNL